MTLYSYLMRMLHVTCTVLRIEPTALHMLNTSSAKELFAKSYMLHAVVSIHI